MSNDSALDIRRIQALTDATFAVAMTILILQIKIPLNLDHPALKQHLKDHLFSELLIYLVGFITLGVFWVGSHYHHHHLEKTDRISSWYNIFFLMTICIIPFSIEFLKNYKDDILSVIFYCAILIVASGFNFLMLVYAWKRRFIKPYFTNKDFRYSRNRILLPILIYLGIILIGFLSTRAAIYLFIVPLALHILPERSNKMH